MIVDDKNMVLNNDRVRYHYVDLPRPAGRLGRLRRINLPAKATRFLTIHFTAEERENQRANEMLQRVLPGIMMSRIKRPWERIR